jgi:ParB family chromosome partitioning protein
MMNARKGGLGRGLEALIPAGPASGAFRMVEVGSIKPNPQQPRARFDDDAIASLAESISELGVLQPLVVAEGDDGGYVLVAGERRWRAAKRAGLTEVPAMVRTVDDERSLTEALVENLQRQDLTPMEQAAAYNQLLEDFGLTHEEVGRRVGRSRASVTNTLRLLTLPATVQGLVDRGELAFGHARALAGLDDGKYATHIAQRAVEEGWSVRQVEEAVRLRIEQGVPPEPDPVVREVRPVEIIELEQRLTERLGTKVKINFRGNKGKVEIRFTSLDDLERIYRTFFT